jgi:hypothetical protein
VLSILRDNGDGTWDLTLTRLSADEVKQLATQLGLAVVAPEDFDPAL